MLFVSGLRSGGELVRVAVAVLDRKSTMDWVNNICCRRTCIIIGACITGTPGPPTGPPGASRKPGGIANVTPVAGVLGAPDGAADWPVDWPVW